ncbi:hypothetical protein AVEN_45916-1 [Araneus ventricosus]|uniref:Uncharacterized protein n=1 Tax=Araneus ventricosus TaxID=182803 RepID=A0A4Y2E7Z8_ARAVE|nr:hypothetical protein AVEN_45916-1 [Araneus ventricosus]
MGLRLARSDSWMTYVNGWAENWNGMECCHTICVVWTDRECPGPKAEHSQQDCSTPFGSTTAPEVQSEGIQVSSPSPLESGISSNNQ